ncbi:MAG TPA: ATP-binding protein [Steroidobacteraceae bacterium]|jgi:signal transduction histidine kinase/DNA-binding response OmpR family regulator
MNRPLLTVAVHYEQDVVVARQRARQIASLLGFDNQAQTRIATAVSEIARNAYRYASGGKVEFMLEGQSAPQLLLIRIEDQGPGIRNLERILSGEYRSETGMGLGILGARRLMDQVDISSVEGRGTNVLLKKILPARAPLVTAATFGRIAHELTARPPVGALEELQEQNRELLRTLGELRERQDELIYLNRELEDTNRGVVALYAELDEKADHLRRADEMKSRFLSNMSHEFRTPLHSIQALSHLLLGRSDGELTDEQARQANFICKAADDLTALVDDLLDLAKIEAGKIEVRPIEFNVTNLFSALRGMLRPLLVGDSVKLIFDEPEAPLELYNDEGKISQILRNFISNAIKFTEHGEVRVSVMLSEDRRTIRFSVADTGVGIGVEDQVRIFEEFTQVPNAMQGKVKGTGLGLPLCRRLARLLHGDVQVSSELGVGSVFSATLPVPFDEGALAVASAAPVEPGLVPVLIVDDEPEMRHVVEKYLRTTRYQPLSARSLRDARALMQRVRPQAIVLDIMLRGEDSWRWLSDLKGNPETAAIPVIVLTSIEDERKGLALGADAYCIKPVSAEKLISKLDSLTAPRVLVIDDDPASRYLMHKLLANNRTCIIEAEDGRSGLAAARRARPSMIFLDLKLPDLGGEDVLESLKADADLHQVPVAIVTSALLSSAERERLGQRAQAVLQKSELDADRARDLLAAHGL